MAQIKPKQSPENILRFNELLRGYLYAKGHSVAWLARKTGLSKTTTTRMINNTDHRGNYYRPKKESVIAVCLALGVSTEQRWELLNLVFPEEAIYTEAMNNGYSVYDTNKMLEAKGLNALTSE